VGELPNAGPGRGASVRRSHIRRWLQTRYFSPASFPFDFCGRRKVSFGTMVLRCRQWSSLRKSGGPTLFDLFLKGERDNAHNSPRFSALTGQSRSNRVSSRGLSKMGIFATTAGDFRRSARPKRPGGKVETEDELAKASCWRPFLALIRRSA
jgi:hypothetical protein